MLVATDAGSNSKLCKSFYLNKEYCLCRFDHKKCGSLSLKMISRKLNTENRFMSHMLVNQRILPESLLSSPHLANNEQCTAEIGNIASSCEMCC
jgi:hypothetical protein